MNSPTDILNNYSAVAKAKTSMSAMRLILLGVLAGAFVAFAGLASTTAAVTVKSASVAKLISACIFPAGLTMVVIAGSELFTGNCLLIISVADRTISAVSMLRNWLFVYTGNFIGSMLVCVGAVYGHQLSLFGNGVAVALMSTATAKCSLSFGDAIIKGILCNVLVCLAVWMGMAAKEAAGKALALFWPIMVFVLCGFEHSIANMFYIGAGLLATGNADYLAAAAAAGIDISALSWGSFLLVNLLPVTIGNIIGGCTIGLVYRQAYSKK